MAATRTGPENLRFLDTWICIRISSEDGADGLSLLDHRAHVGDSPPLHVHHTEDVEPAHFAHAPKNSLVPPETRA